MRFVIDSMLPPQTAEYLRHAGHQAVTPTELGAHSLPDSALVEIATADRWVIVTENAGDFAHVTTCPVIFVRKAWWPRATMAVQLAAALDGWAMAHPQPGSWPHWLGEDYR